MSEVGCRRVMQKFFARSGATARRKKRSEVTFLFNLPRRAAAGEKSSPEQ